MLIGGRRLHRDRRRGSPERQGGVVEQCTILWMFDFPEVDGYVGDEIE